MQHCLVLLLCWEGHYAALFCTSVVLGGILCSNVLYFCCVCEGHYAAMCCTSVVFARDIMQHCLVLLLCWEGHYAALFCTSVVLGGTLCSLFLYFSHFKYKLLEVSLLLQYYVAIRSFEETTTYRNVGIRLSRDAVPYPKERPSQAQYRNFNNSQV